MADSKFSSSIRIEERKKLKRLWLFNICLSSDHLRL